MAENFDSFWQEPESGQLNSAWSARGGMTSTENPPGPEHTTTLSPIDNPIPVQDFEDFRPSDQPRHPRGGWLASHILVTALKVVGIVCLLVFGLFLATRFSGSSEIAGSETDPTSTSVGENQNQSPTTTSSQDQDPSSPITSSGEATDSTSQGLGASSTSSELDATTPSTATGSTTDRAAQQSTATTVAPLAAAPTTTATPTTSTPTTSTPTTAAPTTAAPTTAASETTTPATTTFASTFITIDSNIISQPSSPIYVTRVLVLASKDTLRFELGLDCKGSTERVSLYVNTATGEWPLIADQPCGPALSARIEGLNSGQRYRTNLLFGDNPDWTQQDLVIDFANITR